MIGRAASYSPRKSKTTSQFPQSTNSLRESTSGPKQKEALSSDLKNDPTLQSFALLAEDKYFGSDGLKIDSGGQQLKDGVHHNNQLQTEAVDLRIAADSLNERANSLPVDADKQLDIANV